MAKSNTRRPTPSKRPAAKARPATTAAALPPPSKAMSRTPLYLALAVVVVAAAVAIGIAASRGDDDSPESVATDALGTEVQAVTVDGTPLAPFPKDANASDPAIGQPAPAVTGSSFDGTPVTVTPDDGTPTLLLFVAHWCPHCQAEVPLLAEWITSGQSPAGVHIVTVSTGVDLARDNFPPSAWLQGVDWPTPVLADDADGTVARAYGLSAYPYFVLLDATGVVVDRMSGEIPPADLGTRVTNALA